MFKVWSALLIKDLLVDGREEQDAPTITHRKVNFHFGDKPPPQWKLTNC
ncbi:hypothetical protein [Metasolibacillus sp. FSL K6-0083]